MMTVTFVDPTPRSGGAVHLYVSASMINPEGGVLPASVMVGNGDPFPVSEASSSVEFELGVGPGVHHFTFASSVRTRSMPTSLAIQSRPEFLLVEFLPRLVDY